LTQHEHCSLYKQKATMKNSWWLFSECKTSAKYFIAKFYF
jgi:hypothetical protein